MSWRTRRLNNSTKYQLHAFDDHHFKEEEMKSVGELSHVCSQIVLKCLHLARIGRLDILFPVNTLARSITKLTKACDKRLNRLISFFHHTCECRQYCHVGNTAKQCRLGLFQDSDCAGDLEDSKSTSELTVPSNVQSARQEALLYVFEDNEAVIKMIIKGRSPTMRHVSRTHRVALDWLFDRINLDSKIQFKYIDTKNKLADILTKGNFTRDEWNHLLNLFNICHFSSTACTAAMAKRAQQESGEERVTAKSRPMMNLIARMPSVVSSSSSSNPGRTSLWISRSWEICCGARSIRET